MGRTQSWHRGAQQVFARPSLVLTWRHCTAGELSLLQNEPRAASVTAQTAVRAFHLPRADFTRIIGPMVAMIRWKQWSSLPSSSSSSSSAAASASAAPSSPGEGEARTLTRLGPGVQSIAERLRSDRYRFVSTSYRIVLVGNVLNALRWCQCPAGLPNRSNLARVG